MKISEAAAILTKASSFDKRTVGEADAIAWAEALDGIRPQDAIAAVVAHFTESSEWLTPSHVRKIVRQTRRARIGDTSMILPPQELADLPERENAWVGALRDALGDGVDMQQAIATANASQGIKDLPLEITAGSEKAQEIKKRMEELTADLARAKSIEQAERDAKAEALRIFKAERKAQQDANPEDPQPPTQRSEA